ncbi:MAG: Transcriptional regulatory protein ZraR [bacterium ADurb.Bin243]|nr:MAG: Transcriptional regulatory protein ZraR [bacterium ADurb.Bin243]
MKWTILIADDEQAQLNLLTRYFESKKYAVHSCASMKDALNKAELYSPDMIITDFAMPDGSGLELVKEAKKILPSVSAIIITAYGTIKTAVEAIKHGVDNFLEKPINLELLEAMAQNILNGKKVAVERDVLKNSAIDPAPAILGNDPKIKNISRIIQTVAPLNTSVLITGPTGCGKEVAAAAIWRQSERNGRQYLKINCASIPETLFESELFGHEKGAFTGAVEKKAGIIEAANGGTLLMDEIADLPMAVQPKLLRFLESREYYRVGSSKPGRADIRMIFATKTDLMRAVEKKEFREDLYFRINVVNIEMPPLRERKADIAIIFEHFVKIISKKMNREAPALDKELVGAIESYDWPGNIRELINAVERALIFSNSPALKTEDLSLAGAGLRPDTQIENIFNFFGRGLNAATAKLEKIYIADALKMSKNQTEAAIKLGISERVLRYKMKVLDIR